MITRALKDGRGREVRERSEGRSRVRDVLCGWPWRWKNGPSAKESRQPLRAGKAMDGSCPRASRRNTDPWWISNPQNSKMQQQQSCYGPMKPKVLSGPLQKKFANNSWCYDCLAPNFRGINFFALFFLRNKLNPHGEDRNYVRSPWQLFPKAIPDSTRIDGHDWSLF